MDELTFKEYRLLMESVRLKSIDQSFFAHLSAWAQRKAETTVEKGKKVYYKYERFEDFFDYEGLIKGDGQHDLKKASQPLSDLQELMKKANS